MSQVFGKKDTVAKSWSDMWEEDEEEEREATLRARREINARGFSHESVKEEVPPVPALPLELKRPSDLNARSQRTPRRISSYSKLSENETLPWQPKTPKRSSPKLFPVDKWSELGNRRRNPTGTTEAPLTATKKSTTTQGSITKKRSGSTAQDQSWHRRQSRNKSNKSRPAYLDQDWRQHKVIDSSEDEDHEWVGGWRNFHL